MEEKKGKERKMIDEGILTEVRRDKMHSPNASHLPFLEFRGRELEISPNEAR
jgi:hypothetical protein